MAMNAKTKKYLNSQEHQNIKADLLDQLERNGNMAAYHVDLVNDYMDLWVEKSLLRDDIQRRGVNIKYNNGGGQTGVRKNDSIEQKVKVNTQMLKILSDLGIKWLTASKGSGGTDPSGGEPADDEL
jgi:hypothetical protein